MKYVIVSFLLLFSFGCVKNVPKQQEIFINRKLQSFISDNPNWSQNDLISEKVDFALKDSIGLWKHNSEFLKGMPFKLEKVLKVTDKGKNIHVAYFTRETLDLSDCYNGERIDLKVLGLIQSKDVDSLVNDQHYELSGEYLKTLGGRVGKGIDDYYLGNYEFRITSYKKVHCSSPI